jgi:uncharacterized protein (TIGR00661 family)
MILNPKKNILICPLDWGLGHATRCIPIIHKLYSKGQNLFIVCSKSQISIVREDFPNINWIPCATPDFRYSSGKLSSFDLIKLIPKIIFSIRRDKKNIELWIKKYDINLIISDNRYGCYAKKVPSIIITHQIKLELPKPFKWAEKIMYKQLKKLMGRFDRCWIPDVLDMPNFAGDLTTKYSLNGKSAFIGILSRFDILTFPVKQTECLYEVIGIVSGPEPQRSIFADILLSQMKKLNKSCILVLGKADEAKSSISDGLVIIYNYLNSQELFNAIQSSKYIIARSGYSTIMDLISLKRLAVLVPTPGQTEQEYLAQYYNMRKMFVVANQNELDLQETLNQLSVYKWSYNYTPISVLEKEIEHFISL